MATKKQRHEAAVARREAYLDDLKRENELALKKTRENRIRKAYLTTKDVHEKDHALNKRDVECPWCVDENAKHAKAQREMDKVVKESDKKPVKQVSVDEAYEAMANS